MDKIKIGVVNFKTEWGNKEKNTDIPIFNGDWSPKLYNKLYSEFT